MKGKALTGFKVFGLAAVLMLGIVSIIASGGGGGGGTTAPVTKNYTGLTTQAQIDGDNAALLAIGAWLGGQFGTSLDIFGAVQAGPGGNSFSLGLMPLIFDDVVTSIGIPDFAVQPNVGIVTQEPFTILGSCNEGMDFVIEGGATVASGATINEITGAFSFNISFNNYCEVQSGEPLILNGKVKMTGYLDPGTINNELELPVMEKYTITFNSITLEYFESGDSITIMGESSSKKGIFSADWTVTPSLVTMSYVIKDNSSDPVVTYWFKNVEIELEWGEGYTDLTGMTGSFYHPLYGFVVMSIGDVIHMLDGEFGPESGSLIVTGTGETKALLSFWGTNLFEIHADTTGDGVYDYSDPDNPYSWSEL